MGLMMCRPSTEPAVAPEAQNRFESLGPDLLEEVVRACAWRFPVALACRATRSAARAGGPMRTTPRDVVSSVQTLEWARRLRCPWDDMQIAIAAAANNCPEVLARSPRKKIMGRDYRVCRAAAGARAFRTLELAVESGWPADVVVLEHARACGAAGARSVAMIERSGVCGVERPRFDVIATPCGGTTYVHAIEALIATDRASSVACSVQVPAKASFSVCISQHSDIVNNIRLVGAAKGARVSVVFPLNEPLDTTFDMVIATVALPVRVSVLVTQERPMTCTLEWTAAFLPHDQRVLYSRNAFVAGNLLYTEGSAWPIGPSWRPKWKSFWKYYY